MEDVSPWEREKELRKEKRLLKKMEKYKEQGFVEIPLVWEEAKKEKGDEKTKEKSDEKTNKKERLSNESHVKKEEGYDKQKQNEEKKKKKKTQCAMFAIKHVYSEFT